MRGEELDFIMNVKLKSGPQNQVIYLLSNAIETRNPPSNQDMCNGLKNNL